LDKTKSILNKITPQERAYIKWGILQLNYSDVIGEEECQSLLDEFCTLKNDKTNTLHYFSVDVTKTTFPWVKILQKCEPFLDLLWGIPPGTLKLHGGFVINYSSYMNKSLQLHTDDSDITINLCLQTDCEGTQVRFHGHRSTKIYKPDYWAGEVDITPQKLWALVHEGQHQHETLPVQSGERWNVVLWFKKF